MHRKVISGLWNQSALKAVTGGLRYLLSERTGQIIPLHIHLNLWKFSSAKKISDELLLYWDRLGLACLSGGCPQRQMSLDRHLDCQVSWLPCDNWCVCTVTRGVCGRGWRGLMECEERMSILSHISLICLWKIIAFTKSFRSPPQKPINVYTLFPGQQLHWGLYCPKASTDQGVKTNLPPICVQ